MAYQEGQWKYGCALWIVLPILGAGAFGLWEVLNEGADSDSLFGIAVCFVIGLPIAAWAWSHLGDN
jgi:hypothetical protein